MTRDVVARMVHGWSQRDRGWSEVRQRGERGGRPAALSHGGLVARAYTLNMRHNSRRSRRPVVHSATSHSTAIHCQHPTKRQSPSFIK